MHHLFPAGLAGAVALALPASASDLLINGQSDAEVAIGSSVALSLTGGAGLPAIIAIDITPGPVTVFGASIPLGLTPAFAVIAQGGTDASGEFATTLDILDSPSFIGQQIFFAGVLIDAASPSLLDVSDGNSIVFVPPILEAIDVPLAGKVRAVAPFFDWVGVVPQGEPLDVAIDPGQFGGLVGTEVDIYVTEDRDETEWGANPILTDISSTGATTVTISSGDLTDNTFTLDAGLLSGDGGASLGVPYDVVVDVNRNGELDAGDLIDGRVDGAGIHITRDPSLPGPHTPVETSYTGGTFLGQNLFYPSDIDQLFDVPIIVISHGNGHNFQWYDHLGLHLASYGYVVMSHQNNTVPGVGPAATTTLTNTDFFLRNLDQIVGGLLEGHLDENNITWLGHSRGGEGVTIAFDRLLDGSFIPTNYTADDIVLISSIAPTDFLGTGTSDPHDTPYHLWVGGSDSDVTGCSSTDIVQSYNLLGRASDQRQSISLNGVGHGNFHNGGGFQFATGPCLVGMANTHGIMRGYLFPLVEYHTRGNAAGLDYLWRHYDDLAPQSAPLSNPCVVANLQFREALDDGRFVIDDFQSEPSTAVASSGATITNDLETWIEGRLDDNNTTFTNLASDPFNGMTYASPTDLESGAILSFIPGNGTFLAYDIPVGDQDWTGFERLAFRACQTTRHPFTTLQNQDVLFSVCLVDGDGNEATLPIGNPETGVAEPYQRTGCGVGVGWGNEFESFRMGLLGFQATEPALDLGNIARLEFRFGEEFGSLGARLGLDDIELHVR